MGCVTVLGWLKQGNGIQQVFFAKIVVASIHFLFNDALNQCLLQGRLYLRLWPGNTVYCEQGIWLQLVMLKRKSRLQWRSWIGLAFLNVRCQTRLQLALSIRR